MTRDSETAAFLTTRIGRRLEADERRSLAILEQFYAQYGNTERILESALCPLLNGFRSWSWDRHELWPTPPANAWEAWLYVSHWAAGRQIPTDPILKALTTPDEIAALVSPWDRQKQVAKWREWLRIEQSRTGRPSGEAFELHAAVDGKAVSLKWRNCARDGLREVSAMRFAEWNRDWHNGALALDSESRILWREFAAAGGLEPVLRHADPKASAVLNVLLRTPGLEDRVLGPSGKTFGRSSERLGWKSENADGDYRFFLTRPDGSPPPELLVAVDGNPALYVSATEIFECDSLHGLDADPRRPVSIPAPALETAEGISLVQRLGVPPPPQLAERVRQVRVSVEFRCSIVAERGEEFLHVKVRAGLGDGIEEYLGPHGWVQTRKKSRPANLIVVLDRSLQGLAERALTLLRVNADYVGKTWSKAITKKFPAQWLEWVSDLPDGVTLTLDPMLASLQQRPVTASVGLEVEEAAIDWFDLQVKLSVSETELTPAEVDILLAARGEFVRLGNKGWRRLEYEIDPEDEERMADIGLNARDLSSEKQRFHALQLAGKSAIDLLGKERAELMSRRVAEIKTRVSPAVPSAIRADLRPYQTDGFHFLAYLSTNRFGGVLADDMGLGKTLQTLTWIAWLREQADFDGSPVLVVCPKSVAETWRSETARFYPGARVRIFRPADEVTLTDAVRESDIVVVNYSQLRLGAVELSKVKWHAAVLDEAQYIKNPSSQTAKAAFALKAANRLALSGTPIENRLLDLWSIMAFAMPGALGTRRVFTKNMDQKGDPFARRRLAARVRPFVLRRTKKEVAKDLPERIEEDVYCELEGEQAALYKAELKRARSALLQIKTAKELDAHRFTILTSLLRLRQICCHPALVNAKAKDAESAKITALFDLLEPLISEGNKVLVFSQFVEMIEMIREKIAERDWRTFVLTGATENRGELVEQFQSCREAAVFLVSLRAGGFGLNLTAASYVVLFDPWWNPAVENQAIDRTHRIGQTNRVVAYRLLVKESIEEKIRGLQTQKSALAADVLGEENFARALSLDDFRFLVGG